MRLTPVWCSCSTLTGHVSPLTAGHGEVAPLLCNKDPFAIRSMPHIIKMFPRSRFILMIRDGRAVSHSIITRHVTIKGFDMRAYDGSLKDWNRAMGTMWEACKSHGETRNINHSTRIITTFCSRFVLWG